MQLYINIYVSRIRIFLASLLLLPATAALEAGPGDPRPPEQARENRLRALEQSSRAPFHARLDSQSGHLATLRGRFQAEGKDPEQKARAFLRDHADLFGWAPGLGELRRGRQVEDQGGTVLAFHQEYDGLPVFEGNIKVGFDRDGMIIHVSSGYAHGLSLITAPTIYETAALAEAEEWLGRAFDEIHEPTRLVIVRGGKGFPGHHLAWEVRGFTADPRAQWTIFVDAREGRVVRSIDMFKNVGPACVSCVPATDPNCGLLFFPDPVVWYDDPNLRDTDNVDGALAGCKLHNLTSSTNLDGQWATTNITSPRVGPPYNYLRSVNQRAVDEITTYYHVDRSKQYLNALGFTSVMNFALPIDAHDAAVGLNAGYDPVAKTLHFGEGGVDSAQDPSVISHEYGHAIQDNQVPGFGSTLEGGSMGEGFGDYWAASLLEDHYATDLGKECTAPWWATYINAYDGSFGSGCLRRLDFAWEFPGDLRYEVHDDGEIWSAALWDLRNLLGASVTDPLVLKSHTFLTTSAKFIDGADALLSADAAFYGGANAATINGVMKARGFPRTGTPAATAGLDETFTYSCSSTHDYANGEYKVCSATVPGASRVRFHFSSFSTESNFDFVYISDADYYQVQAMSGDLGPRFSQAVRGDTIIARFKADASITDYGFDIDYVEYALGAGSIPDDKDVPGDPLSIQQGPGFFDMSLSWDPSCASGDTDYAVYEGSLFNLSILTPKTCSTGGLTSLSFTASGGSKYFLVVPNNGGAEGSYGKKSDGTERAPSSSACLPQEVMLVCQ